MPSARAPRGGIVIGQRHYRGGKFIPASVMDLATPEQKKQLRPPRQFDLPGMLKKLTAHKQELNPKQLDFLRRVHEGLSNKYGNNTPHAVATHADSLLKAHGSAKHPDHQKSLTHHLGNAHELIGMSSGGGKAASQGSSETTGSASQVETGVKDDSMTIVVKSTGDVFTATLGDVSSHAPTAEEAVGKLVMENSEILGLTIDEQS